MTEIHRLPERRQLIADGDRSALRATWHLEAGYVVISLWHGERCVATSHLSPREAGRLAAFITDGLAQMAQGTVSPPTVVTQFPTRRRLISRLRREIETRRSVLARRLESLARRLR